MKVLSNESFTTDVELWSNFIKVISSPECCLLTILFQLNDKTGCQKCLTFTGSSAVLKNKLKRYFRELYYLKGNYLQLLKHIEGQVPFGAILTFLSIKGSKIVEKRPLLETKNSPNIASDISSRGQVNYILLLSEDPSDSSM